MKTFANQNKLSLTIFDCPCKSLFIFTSVVMAIAFTLTNPYQAISRNPLTMLLKTPQVYTTFKPSPVKAPSNLHYTSPCSCKRMVLSVFEIQCVRP